MEEILRRRRLLRSAATFIACLICGTVCAAGPHVEMDVIFEPGLAANAAGQKWTKALGDIGLSGVRFRPMQDGDQVSIKVSGSGNTGVVQVTAVLNGHGVLQTPGGQFTLGDTTRLKKWLDDVQAGGGRPGQATGAFGLNA